MRQAVILAGILFLLGLVCCYKTHTNTKKSEKHSGLLHQESYGVGDKIRPKRVIGLIIFGIACIFLCGRGNSRSSPNSPPPNRPPSIECPRIEQEYTANDGETWKFVEWGEIKAKDPEDGKLKATLTFGLPSGSRFERGIHAIQYSATDKHGLKGFCSLHFRVIDKENPEIYECPNHISTFANRNNQPVIVNWEKPKAKDNSDIVKLEQTMGQPSGSLFSVGKTEIRYQAIDGSGNKSPYCTFLVDVEG